MKILGSLERCFRSSFVMGKFMEKKELIERFMDLGFLPAPDMLLDNLQLPSSFLDKFQSADRPLVISHDVYVGLATNGVFEINWRDFEKSRVLHEKKKNTKMYGVFLNVLHHNIPHTQAAVSALLESVRVQEPTQPNPPEIEEQSLQAPSPSSSSVSSPSSFHTDSSACVQSAAQLPPTHHHVNSSFDPGTVLIVKNSAPEGKKREVKDFSSYFRVRYDFLGNLLKSRPELQDALAISRAVKKMDTEHVSVIGLVYNKAITKNGNCLLTLEDITGRIRVFLGKDGPLKSMIPYLTPDEVVGICGVWRNNMIFADTLVFPDVPLARPLKKTLDEVYAVFISDIHIGSKLFFEEAFLRFIAWLNGEFGTSAQRETARKVKYLFVVGDVVDGVGIYPSQEKELLLTDIRQQYQRAAELFARIRQDVRIIMCPGNHDAGRISEPQLPMGKICPELAALPHVMMVSNPSLVNVHASETFEGIDVLLYHGYGYDDYVSMIEPLRLGGGYNRIDLVMKFMLQKRHLAPTHTTTLYIPTPTEDALLIDHVPDVFVSGHVHKSAVGLYRGVSLIVNSCWQDLTPFQEKMGHTPDPGFLAALNLHTREVTVYDFLSDSQQIKEEHIGFGRDLTRG